MPEDAALLQMRLFGRFPLDDPERFARYLQKTAASWSRG